MARGIFVQIVHALMHMHARGVCHRDIKLDNIFVVPAARAAGGGSKGFVVKIIDFGIGELMRPGHRLSLQCGACHPSRSEFM